jgi:antitoxin PrlF
MSETVIVSRRGQITLPASMRRHLGIEPGGAVLIEERDGELTVKPAMVLEVEHYRDDEIAQWDREDKLSPEERHRILARLQAE